MRLDMATARMSKGRAWLRVCRPLLLWLAVFFSVLAYQWHLRLLQRTRLLATVYLSGKEVRYSARATLDGKPYDFGELVALGQHDLIIQCPKADNFRTKIFVWYGECNLGEIQLRRSKGWLDIAATPAAASVKIMGPELQTNFADVTAETVTVPTDTYTVTAVYRYFTLERLISVDRQSLICSFAPDVGVLQAEAVQPGTHFELRRVEDSQMNRRILEQGELPATVTPLEVGKYRLRASYRGAFKDHTVEITAHQTNRLGIDFPLGKIALETTPAGATVRDREGHEYGITPLTLEEMPIGLWRGEVILTNYTPISVAIEVLEKATATFQTNLTRLTFAKAMQLTDQQRHLADPDFEALIEAWANALQDDPGNSVASNMLNNVRTGQTLRVAENKFKHGDFAGALQAAEAALTIMPDNLQAQHLADQSKKTMQDNQAKADAIRSKEEGDRRRETMALKERRPREYFNELMRTIPNNAMFQEKELKVRGGIEGLRTKIAEELSSGLLKYNIEENKQPFEEGFMIRGKMNMLDGWRRCYLVGGQTSDREVTLRFKVFEYTWPSELAISALINRPSEDKGIPINSSHLIPQLIELRRSQGIQFVTDRIRKAEGK